MKRALLASACALALNTCAHAQQSTAIGVGIGVAKSTSKSEATAIGGGVGNAGQINPSASITTNGAPLISQNTPASQSIKTVPTVFAPGLTAAGIESCLGSVSGGGSWLGTGISLGGTIPDAPCSARLDARTLWSFGLKKAAVARLCINSDIYNSMPDVCAVYLPRPIVAPAPAGFYPPSNQFSYNPDRSIMLVDGRTGVEHLCTNYDEPRQRCRVWADAVVRTQYAANRKRLRHIDPVIPTVTTAATQEDKSK